MFVSYVREYRGRPKKRERVDLSCITSDNTLAIAQKKKQVGKIKKSEMKTRREFNLEL